MRIIQGRCECGVGFGGLGRDSRIYMLLWDAMCGRIYIDAQRDWQPTFQLPTSSQCHCLALTPEQSSTDNHSRVQTQQEYLAPPQVIKLKMTAGRPAIFPHCGTYSLAIPASYPDTVHEQTVMRPLCPPALQYPLQHPPQTRGL